MYITYKDNKRYQQKLTIRLTSRTGKPKVVSVFKKTCLVCVYPFILSVADTAYWRFLVNDSDRGFFERSIIPISIFPRLFHRLQTGCFSRLSKCLALVTNIDLYDPPPGLYTTGRVAYWKYSCQSMTASWRKHWPLFGIDLLTYVEPSHRPHPNLLHTRASLMYHSMHTQLHQKAGCFGGH